MANNEKGNLEQIEMSVFKVLIKHGVGLGVELREGPKFPNIAAQKDKNQLTPLVVRTSLKEKRMT